MYKKILCFISDYRAEIASGLTLIFSIFSQTIQALNLIIAMFVFSILTVCSGVCSICFIARTKPVISKLITENAELKKSLTTCTESNAVWGDDYYVHFDELLQVVFKNFIKLTTDYRISVYKYDNKGAFILLGRFAEHPDWRCKRKVIYPADEGIIKRVWESHTGYAKIQNTIPDPVRDIDGYVAQQQKYKIPEERSKNFVMKSRSYVACTLKDTKGKTAIIVFESVKGTMDSRIMRLINQKLKEGRGLTEIIISHVRRHNNVTPSFDNTNKRGF